FAAYRFDLVAQAVYEFTWNELCDWFLELAKPALNGGDAAAADSTRHTLLFVLDALLRLLHPLIPFVTEEIWQNVAPRLGIEGKSISVQTFPTADVALQFADDASGIEWLKVVVSQLRRIRSELTVKPAQTIPVLFSGGSESDRARTARYAGSIAFLTKAASQRWLDSGEDAPASAPAVIGDMTVLVPLQGLVDLDAEKTRLAKEIKRLEGEIAKCHGKLGNANFVANAPAEVVEQERDRLRDFSQQLDGLKGQLGRL
ncbi:MAG: class I tRNA ligase family protein, partial [Xanthomonadales bacterium]|nr:class I tRNA ligase family protein [Xanthomonadales bacterium]